MGDMKYVGESSWRAALGWEARFRNLPPEAGVIFIAVEPEPAPEGECSVFDVRLGIARKYEESVGLALIRKVLERDLAAGSLSIRAAIYRGTPGSYDKARLSPDPGQE